MTRIGKPTPSYVGSTNLIPIPGGGGQLITSVSDGTLTVTFSVQMITARVPADWSPWGSPPETEPGSVGTIVHSQGAAQVTLTLSQPVSVFGFEGSISVAAKMPVTAVFMNGGTTLGSIVRPVNGVVTARLFAARNDTFTSVTVSIQPGPIGAAGIAFGRLRYAI